MTIINFHDEHLNPMMHRQAVAFVAEAIGSTGFGPCSSMGISKDGCLIGAVIFHDWHPDRGTIEMSFHGKKGWISRRAMNACMDYVFSGLKCQAAFGQARSDMPDVLEIDRRIFPNEVVVPRLMGREVDGHVFSITEEQWNLHPMKKTGKLTA